jgi:hypothetical protein
VELLFQKIAQVSIAAFAALRPEPWDKAEVY